MIYNDLNYHIYIKTNFLQNIKLFIKFKMIYNDLIFHI